MRPKVSIVVAIYNVAQYIEDCVRSLCRQTLDDIEIILVDDCSPDNSIELAMRVLEEFPHRKPQVKVVRHEKNTGSKEVRKDGVAQADGEYIIHVDGDDYADERMAELMYSKAVETDADIVICDFWWYHGNSRRYIVSVPKDALSDSDFLKDGHL